MSSTEHPHKQLVGEILYETGEIYAVGLVCTSSYYFLKGTYKSPYGQRFIGATQAVGMNANWFPKQLAVYSCLLNTFECTLISLRQKDDAWNEIVAGAASSGCLDIRRGLVKASRRALIGGVVVAALTGVESMWWKYQDIPKPPNRIIASIQGQDQASLAVEISQPSACPWLRGLFYGSKKGHDN
ncbi:unnamed protein product [Rhodiola kirilowii]